MSCIPVLWAILHFPLNFPLFKKKTKGGQRREGDVKWMKQDVKHRLLLMMDAALETRFIWFICFTNCRLSGAFQARTWGRWWRRGGARPEYHRTELSAPSLHTPLKKTKNKNQSEVAHYVTSAPCFTDLRAARWQGVHWNQCHISSSQNKQTIHGYFWKLLQYQYQLHPCLLKNKMLSCLR